MSKTPNYDAKVKAILDGLTPGERVCALTGEKWMMDEEEINWYKLFNVPPSKMSQTTRWFVMNGETLGYEWWWNKHAETGKPILTYVHPATGIKVLPDVEWHQKDFVSAGRSFDPLRSVFEQMLPIRKEVPLVATFNLKEPQNSIALLSYGDVNSYFVLACRSRESIYSSDAFDCEAVAEAFTMTNATQCYRVICGARLHNVRYASHSYDCSNSAFLFDCRNCEFCFGATNQRNKKYVWFNEQLTKDEWERRRTEVDLGRRGVVEAQSQAFEHLLEVAGFWPENFNEKAQDCSGEYLRNTIDCKMAFACADGLRDNAWICYCYGKSERNYMACGVVNGSDNYFAVTTPECKQCSFVMNLTRCQNVEYSMACLNCENCFGCFGLNHKKFCLFNRQYTEEEYWIKLDEVKSAMLDRGEYGEFFPTSFSSTYFMEGVAGINLGATKEDQVKYGFPTYDLESAGAVGDLGDVTQLRDSDTVPDSIDELDIDAWAGVPMIDKQAGRRFAFLRPELEFYKKYRIAPPTRHFISRVDSLYHSANLFVLEETPCAVCGKVLQVAKNMTFKNRKHLCREDYLKFLEKR